MSRRKATAAAQLPVLDSPQAVELSRLRQDFERYLREMGVDRDDNGHGAWFVWSCGCLMRNATVPIEAAWPKPCDKHRGAIER